MPSTSPNRAARRRRPARFPVLAAATLLTLSLSAPPAGAETIEGDYGYDPGPAQTTWYGPADPAAKRADLDYIAAMRPHHAGALTMSQEYLADPASSSPLLRQLARAIVANQRFEVALLDEAARNLAQPPVSLLGGLVELQPMATEGLAQALRFRRDPIPTALTYAVGPVSARDVQFAKAMIIHHRGALDMARAYLASPHARNGFLGLLNVDIRTDQAQEIALMRRAMHAYPGDVEAVRVDPSMVRGMEGMVHGGAGEAGVTPAAPPAAVTARTAPEQEGHAHHH